jgi:hypothetical protein
MSTEGLHPSTQRLMETLIAAGIIKQDQITSGYRDPETNARVGGAKGSQHLHGRALDLSTAGMTDEQRQKLLEAAMNAGARGVGIYPSGALHLDTRDTPAFWGPGGSYKGTTADKAPAWAQPHIAKLLGQPGAPVPPTPPQPPVPPQPPTPPVPQDFWSKPLFGGGAIQGSAAPVPAAAAPAAPATPPTLGAGLGQLAAFGQRATPGAQMGQTQPDQALMNLWQTAMKGGQIANMKPEDKQKMELFARVSGLLG